MTQRFKAKLSREGPGGAWTFLSVPFDVQKEYGTRGRVSVKGTINGFAFRTSIAPMGNGTHAMMVNKSMQAGASVAPGDTVAIVMEQDKAERTVALSPELKKAFAKNQQAKSAFDQLSFTHRRDFADWVGAAKGEDTKKTRVEKTLQMLREGITLASIQKQRYMENKAKRTRS